MYLVPENGHLLADQQQQCVAFSFLVRLDNQKLCCPTAMVAKRAVWFSLSLSLFQAGATGQWSELESDNWKDSDTVAATGEWQCLLVISFPGTDTRLVATGQWSCTATRAHAMQMIAHSASARESEIMSSWCRQTCLSTWSTLQTPPPHHQSS